MDRFTSFKAPADEEKGFFSRLFDRLSSSNTPSPPPAKQQTAPANNGRASTSSPDAPVVRISTPPGAARSPITEPAREHRAPPMSPAKSPVIEETQDKNDFRMKSESALVCYQCDAPFTVLNRRKYCAACGQIFCGKCTRRTEASNLNLPKAASKGLVRVCDYCFDRLSINPSAASVRHRPGDTSASGTPMSARHSHRIGSGSGSSGLSMLEGSHLDLDASDDEETFGGAGEEEELLSKTYKRVSLLNLKSLMNSSMSDLEEAGNVANYSSGFGDSSNKRGSASLSNADKAIGRTSSSDDNSESQCLSPSHSPTSKKQRRRSKRFSDDGTKDAASDSDGPLSSSSPRESTATTATQDKEYDEDAGHSRDNEESDESSTDSSDDFNDLGQEQFQEDTFNRWFSRPINNTSEEEIDDPLRARNEGLNSGSPADGPTLRPSFLQTVTGLTMPPSSISSTGGRKSNPSESRKTSFQANSNGTPSLPSDTLRRLHHKSLSRAHFSVDGNIALPTTPEVKHVRVVSHSLLSAFGERSEGGTMSSHESAFRTMSIGHLEHITDLLIDKYGLEKRWKPKMIQFADTAVVSLKLFVKQGDSMDILQYSKVKVIPGGSYDECEYIEGLVFDGERVKRTMKSSITNARVLLLGCSLDYERREGVLLSIDKVLQQEKEYLTLLVAKLTTTISPTIIFVERNVSLMAQQMLAEKGVCVLQNVKLRTLQVLARLTGAAILASTDHASPSSLGKCPSFEIADYYGPWGAKSCAIVRGPQQKFGTVLLRGAPKPTLDKVKQVIQFLIYAAYNLVLENHLLYEQTATTMFDASSIMRSKASYIASRARNGTLSDSDHLPSGDHSTEDPLANSPFVERKLFQEGTDASTLASKPKAPAKENDAGQNLEGMTACSKACLISTSWSVAVPREKAAKAMPARDTVYNVCPSITLPPLHAELKQTCEVRLENGTFDVPAPPGPTLNFSYRSLLVPNEQLCSDPEIPAIPPPGKNMRPSFASQQINHLRKKRIHAFKQFAPQHLIYLHSLYSPATSMQCLPYTPQIIHFYSSNDMTLGQFLEDFCFNDKSRCLNEECHRPTSEHERCILHADGRVNIAVRPFDVSTIFDNPTAADRPKTPAMGSESAHPLVTPTPSLSGSGPVFEEGTSSGANGGKHKGSKFDSSKILMWAACKNLQRQAPYMVPMSRETWNFSLGKFLELLFYSAHTRCRTCNEPTYRGHVRYFYYNNKVVMFEYEQLKSYDTSIPPMQVSLEATFAHKLMHQEIDEVVKLSSAMYEAVLAKVVDLEDASTKLDDEEELRSVTIMHRSLEEEKSQFMELVQKERYSVDNVAGTTVFQVTRLRRLFYWNIRRWNDSVSAEEGRVQKKWKAFMVAIKEKEKQEIKDREKIEKDLAQIKRHLNRDINDRLSREPTPSIEGAAPPNPSPKSSLTASLSDDLPPGSGHSARSTISGGPSPRNGTRSRSGSVDANASSPVLDAGGSKSTPGRSRSLSNSAAVTTPPARATLGAPSNSGSQSTSPKMATSPRVSSAKLPPLPEIHESPSKAGNVVHETDEDEDTPALRSSIEISVSQADSEGGQGVDKFSAAVNTSHSRHTSDQGPSSERHVSSASGKVSDMMTIPILRPQGSSSQELLFDMIGSPPPAALLVVPQLNFTNHELLKEKPASPSAPTSTQLEASRLSEDDASSDHSSHDSVSDDPLRMSDSSAPTSLTSQIRPSAHLKTTSVPVPTRPSLASSSESHPLGLSGSLSRESSLLSANLGPSMLSQSPASSGMNVRFSGSVPAPNQNNLALAPNGEAPSRFREALQMVLPQKKTQIIDAMIDMDVYVFPPASVHEPAVAVYENEPSSIMAFALMSDIYREKMLKFDHVPPYFLQTQAHSSHAHQHSTQSAPSPAHSQLLPKDAAGVPFSAPGSSSASPQPMPLSDPFKAQAVASSLHRGSSSVSSSMEYSASAPVIPSAVSVEATSPMGSESMVDLRATTTLPTHHASISHQSSEESLAITNASAAIPLATPPGSIVTPHSPPASTPTTSASLIGVTTAQAAVVTDGEDSPREKFIAAPIPVPIAVMEFNTPASIPSTLVSSPIVVDRVPSPSPVPQTATTSSAHSSSSSLLSDALHNALQHESIPQASPSISHATSAGATTATQAPISVTSPSVLSPVSATMSPISPSLSAAAGLAPSSSSSNVPVGPKSISLDANARFEMSPMAEAAHRGLISPEQTHIDLEWKSTPIWGGPRVQMQCKTYFARQFAWLRNLIGLDERVFAQSLSRCKPWKARGGKSNSRFARTLDERFILKQVQAIELEGFLAFAPIYFDYFSKVYFQQVPTAICKIVGIFSVTMSRKGKSPVKVDLIVQENLFYGHNISKVFDLKGSLRSRYARPESPNDKDVVYQDENLLEMIYTEPICVSNEAKAMLAMTVWNDTLCLSSLNVMDYSLLVGVDQTNGKLVLGIIDYMRTYTWDKQFETYVKRTGILGAGGSKSKIPTIISPKQYKKRFRVAIWSYFLLIPNLNTKLIYDYVANTAQNPKALAAISKN